MPEATIRRKRNLAKRGMEEVGTWRGRSGETGGVSAFVEEKN
jgi:hypothetical protein